MRKRALRYWGALLFALVLLLPLCVRASPLSDFDGHARTIAEFAGKGKWLVVMFWTSDCFVCNREIGEYVKFHAAHRDRDATVLGVSLDGVAGRSAAAAFIAQHRVNFPNVIGEPEAVISLFADLTQASWLGTPTFLIYSPSGTLLAQQAGAVPTELIEDYIHTQGDLARRAAGAASVP